MQITPNLISQLPVRTAIQSANIAIVSALALKVSIVAVVILLIVAAFFAIASLKPTKIKTVTMNAPLSGKFEALAKVGDFVRKGDPLCTLEVMKMTIISRAESSGTIRQIHYQNGAIIQEGQHLFEIRD